MKPWIKLEALLQNATIATGTAVLGAFASTAAVAATIDADGLMITNINQTADNSAFDFDLNGDGIDDYSILTEGKSGREAGTIIGIDTVLSQRALSVAGDVILFEGQRLSAMTRFDEGDAVDGGKLNDLNFAFLGDEGPFATVGDTGFVGLALEFLGDTGVFATHFGWAEIERGSLSVLRVGFQTNANTAAKIPGLADDVAAVPLPASLPLLLAGAGGLLAFRRRRDTKAA